jgi:hypothetical protein
MNDTLENVLKETWKKKDKFYEENKDLSVLEVLIKLENKNGACDFSRSNDVRAMPLKQLEVATG